MKRPYYNFTIAAGTAGFLLCAFLFVSTTGGQAQGSDGNRGVGIPDVFLPKYRAFRARQLASPKPHVMRIRLGYVKGLSRSFTSMMGEMAIDLESGAYNASLSGLTTGQTYSLWLVDRKERDDDAPSSDTVFKLATVRAAASTASLTGQLDPMLPSDFRIDRVVVVPGNVWGPEVLGAGTVNVFQKIFYRRLSLENESTGALMFAETTPAPSFSALVPDLAAGTDAPAPSTTVKLDRLISRGADLFFNGTFGGNGRTCGTCHPASNNFTIDRAFIATLPPNDPLFVAEFNPELAQLERPGLMRRFGLILENLDGLENPTEKFVMRGVPHTLGLQVSLAKDTGLNGPDEMTGWSGDGAPGTGSLREFAIGAVTQHFTQTLRRRPGIDFKLPGRRQLDAMEAFQLSLGRASDSNLLVITFNDPNVEAGKGIFINGTGNPLAGGTCAFCHGNGGALAAFFGNQNRNFNTNVEGKDHPSISAAGIRRFPRDGGFGTAPPIGTLSGPPFGDGTFNTASVVEAADTPPFFHNNVVDTLEEVVTFYETEFNLVQPTGATKFSFGETQVKQLANFLRALNTLQNIDLARQELTEILANRGDPRREQNTRLQSAFEDTQDAIKVLKQGELFPDAVTHLTAARNEIAQAQLADFSNPRRVHVQQANAKLRAAKNNIVTQP
jgi:cytochrome c peroxidase